jgi:uncharacterized protein (DUF934 family)
MTTYTLQLFPAGHFDAPADAPGTLALSNDADPREANLAGVDTVVLDFPAFTDGRAFSQAFLLRRRLGFTGNILATGDVLIDQLQQMQRSGFTQAELRPGQDLAAGQRQLARYASFYQGDAIAPRPRFSAASV